MRHSVQLQVHTQSSSSFLLAQMRVFYYAVDGVYFCTASSKHLMDGNKNWCGRLDQNSLCQVKFNVAIAIYCITHVT